MYYHNVDKETSFRNKKNFYAVKRFWNYFQGCSLGNEGIQSHPIDD